MRLFSAMLGLIFVLPAAASADETDVDYSALTQKVQKAVYIQQAAEA